MSARKRVSKKPPRDDAGRFVPLPHSGSPHDEVNTDSLSQAAASLWYMGRAENATGTANSRASSRIGSNSSGRPADVTESAPDATRGPQQEGDATNAGPLPPASFFGDNELSGSNEDEDDSSSGSDDETDPTEYMLQYVAAATELCSKVDDVGILVNNVDINDVCPKG